MQFLKDLLWVWFSGFFEERLRAMVASHKEMAEIKKAEVVRFNYPVGTKVIVVTNEPGDLKIGEVVWHENISATSVPQYALMVKDQATGEVWGTLSDKPFYWHQELEDTLKKLNWAERWNVYARGISFLSEEDSLRKESDEYQNRNKGVNQ